MNGASGPRPCCATDLWRGDVGLDAVLSAGLVAWPLWHLATRRLC